MKLRYLQENKRTIFKKIKNKFNNPNSLDKQKKNGNLIYYIVEY